MVKKSSKSGISGVTGVDTYATENVQPQLVFSNFRLSFVKSGLDVAGTTTIGYTVPNNRILVIDQIFRLTNAFIAQDAYLEITNSGGNTIYKFAFGDTLSASTNALNYPLILLRGDRIQMYYKTNDVAGQQSFFLQGYEQFDTGLYPVPAPRL